MSDVSKTAGFEITSVPAMRAGHFLPPVKSGLKIRLAVFLTHEKRRRGLWNVEGAGLRWKNLNSIYLCVGG